MAHRHSADDLARALARNAESVCRHYLSNGRREGRYWLAGDTANNPGRSLFVRLTGPQSGKGAAGKWTDAATGEYGDLLDLIRMSRDLSSFCEVAVEAQRFLRLPCDPLRSVSRGDSRADSPRERNEAAGRLFAMATPIHGTLAETYLRKRGITKLTGVSALRFHAGCYYRDQDGTTRSLPALIAAVTDDGGALTGAHRTWLDPGGNGKARVPSPRRAMGALLGGGVRFGFGGDLHTQVIAAGEGIETMLSLRQLMPAMPVIAGLSAAHLGALLVPSGVRRLYVATDADSAGRNGTQRLTSRARQAGIEALTLRSAFGDFNDDLRRAGPEALRLHLLRQLAPDDVRFIV